MRAIFTLLLAVSTLANAECRVREVSNASKVIECDSSSVVRETRREKELYYWGSAPDSRRLYNSLPSDASVIEANRAMVQDYYKDVGGYQQGKQLYRGNGFYTWYK